MDKIITIDLLRSFTYSNHDICAKPIRGVVVSFMGLGNTATFNDHTPEGVFFAKRGIVYLTPYLNPWAWMNDQAVAYTDEVVDVIFDAFNLPESTPVISTGGSMGGQSALVYTAKAKRTPKACVTNCPVCDLVFHYTERPDLPRTLYSAFFSYDGTIESALAKASPVHLAEKMPRVKYINYHCTQDKAVNFDRHSALFVDKMRALNHDIDFIPVEGCGHCALPPDVRADFMNRIANEI